MARRTVPIAPSVKSSNWNVADGAILIAIGLPLILSLGFSSEARSWALGRLGYAWIPVSIWLFAALLTLRYHPGDLAPQWRWWVTTAVLVGITVGTLSFFQAGHGVLSTASLGGYWGGALGGTGWFVGLIRLTIAAGLTGLVIGPQLVARSLREVLRIAGLSLYHGEEGFFWFARFSTRTMHRWWLLVRSGLRRLRGVGGWRFWPNRRSLAETLRTGRNAVLSHLRAGMRPAVGRRSVISGEAMDAQGIVSRALQMKSNDFQVSNIQVTTELAEDLPLTLVDKPGILHAIVAVLTNSEQAMWVHRGGGHLVVSSVRRGDALRITVTDDGPGVPAGGLSDVIQPISVSDESEGGRRLGLGQCRSLIVKLGGDLWVENRPGNGAIFNIYFPILDPTCRDSAPTDRQSSFAE